MQFTTVVGRLAAAGCIAADEEARELMVAASDRAALEVFVRRRERGEPLPWITGTVRFCGRPIRIDPGVYVPRPQSEALAYRASAILSQYPHRARAIDLCTGCGAIAAHLMSATSAAVVGMDSDPLATTCARRNGIATVLGDVRHPPLGDHFDVVTVVAPYVPTRELAFLPADVQRYEPRSALDGGIDGLDVVKEAIRAASKLLRPAGVLLAEVGGGQDRELVSYLEAHRFGSVRSWHDEDGDLRGFSCQLKA